MQLLSLHITNFKNISEASLEFSPKINCFLGNNGMGKSNLLDAVYFMSVCRSFMGVTDAMVISSGEEFTTVRAEYLRGEVPETLTLGIARGKRKSLRRGGKEYGRLSEHIGLFPLVLATPSDMDLIRGHSDERRRWMDMVISQSDRRYLEALIRYNTALEQRNKLLRDAVRDPALFEAVEIQMDMAATVLHSRRSSWTQRLSEIATRFYETIAGAEGEKVELAYRSSLEENGQTEPLTEILARNRGRDEAVRHTTAGPHRDDIEMSVNSLPMRRTASQGQCKTFTTALRLAQYEFLRESTGLRPLLLLDDIFDKLDSTRVERIISLVTTDCFGQIFITDTNRAHLDDIMSHTAGNHRLWSVDSGRFTLLP